MNEIVKYKNEVAVIKEAILRSQYRAVSVVNKEQLSLYYGIGQYVSENSRKGFWGTGAIKQISEQLQKELPGLRGFSATNMKNMRIFYDEWKSFINRQPLADDLPEFRQLITDDLQNAGNLPVTNRSPLANDLAVNENLLLMEIRQPTTEEFDGNDFLKIGFSHHMEIFRCPSFLHSRMCWGDTLRSPKMKIFKRTWL